MLNRGMVHVFVGGYIVYHKMSESYAIHTGGSKNSDRIASEAALC
jgi:hypothetical protein